MSMVTAVRRRPVEVDYAGRLEFVTSTNSRTGTVHVVAIEDDPDFEGETFGSFTEGLLALAAHEGATLTMCGTVVRRHRGGLENGGSYIKCFADERLCQRCHQALGDDAHRAFEHPVPRSSDLT